MGRYGLRLSFSPITDLSNMSPSNAPGLGPELEHAMDKLDISSHYPSPQPQAHPQPYPQPHPQQPQTSQESSHTVSDQQHQRDQAGSSQHSGQIGGAPKTSNEQVWYLKSIEFTSPSGVTRSYNIITQNYNGYVFFVLSLVGEH